MSSQTSNKTAGNDGWLKPAVDAAARGMIAIRRCARCGRNHYPPREICPFCLDDRLDWEISDRANGVMLAQTVLHHSNEEKFRARLPLRVGLVHLQCGPTVVAFVDDRCIPGSGVMVSARLDEEGRPVLAAVPQQRD